MNPWDIPILLWIVITCVIVGILLTLKEEDPRTRAERRARRRKRP